MYQLYMIPPLETKKIAFKRYVSDLYQLSQVGTFFIYERNGYNMYYDVAVNRNYDKACELYNALVKVNCSKLLYPYVCYLRETVNRNPTHPCKYGYRIEKKDNGCYQYMCFLYQDESENFISLDKFLNILQPERTVTL